MNTVKFYVAGSGCCPCPDVAGCNCQTVCALECRAKSGLAELCGHSEFVDPSVPPKKYRRRELKTGVGAPFVICTTQDGECIEPACPGTYDGGWVGEIGGHVGEFTCVWVVTLQGVAGGIATYDVSVIGTRDGVLIAGKIRFERSGIGYDRLYGQTIDLPVGQVWNVAAYVLLVSWNVVPGSSSCMTAARPSISGLYDVWDLVQQYGLTTCLLAEVDNSNRRAGSGDSCAPSLPATTPGNLLCASPGVCYGSGVTVVVAPALITYEGVGCVESPPGTFRDYSGTITDALSEEDTEDDAITRAAPTSGDLIPVSSCLDAPAFITERGAGEFSFGYRRTQVRVRLIGLAAGNYNVTIRFYRRALGSSAPHALFSEYVLNVQADSWGTDDYTEWVEVPNEVGFETRPQVCQVEPA